MSGIQNFGLLIQTLLIEHQRYREVRAEGEEDSKRRMYALEKRYGAGETLHPSDLLFLLNMQDKYGRPPSVADRAANVPSLKQRIDWAIEEEKLAEQKAKVEAEKAADNEAIEEKSSVGAEILSTVFCSFVVSGLLMLASATAGLTPPVPITIAVAAAVAGLFAFASATVEIDADRSGAQS